MTQTQTAPNTNLFVAIIAVLAALVGGAAVWLWQLQSVENDPAAMLAKGERAAIEKVVRDYIVNNPEVLPEAMQNLRNRENEKQLAGIEKQLKTPFPGAVLGNPAGTVTLVEFTDFACGYCRQSVADVAALIKENPDLRVVVRELPIISPASAAPARMGLAAAEQGKYPAFHHAMFAAGRPDAAAIEAAARTAGLDLDRARRVIANPATEAELNRNMDYARQLGFDGTPSWVVGSQIISGAVGKEELARAIAAARG